MALKKLVNPICVVSLGGALALSATPFDYAGFAFFFHALFYGFLCRRVVGVGRAFLYGWLASTTAVGVFALLEHRPIAGVWEVPAGRGHSDFDFVVGRAGVTLGVRQRCVCDAQARWDPESSRREGFDLWCGRGGSA